MRYYISNILIIGIVLVVSLKTSALSAATVTDNCAQQQGTLFAPIKGNKLKAAGGRIVKSSGEEFIIRSIGLGGWFLQEGYMYGTSGAQWELKEFFKELAGEKATNEFYSKWLENFVCEADVQHIAKSGYNTIRIPLHYNLFFDESGEWIHDRTENTGLIYLHRLVNWASKNNLYVIPDLHAAPGGQGNNKDISDRNPAKPNLWESLKNQEMTILFWKNIAKEFVDYDYIGGYDLLNEVNYDFENTGDKTGSKCEKNEPLRNLYKQIIKEIRAVDKNRILFIEGNAYANNFNGLEELFSVDFADDKNLAFSFHKYWNENNQTSISKYIDLRTKHNRPLWLGETGENSNAWFTAMVKLMEQNGIGWSNWPWKKIGTIDGPMYVHPTPEWKKIIDYRNMKTAIRPTSTEAQKALIDIANNIKLENCTPFPCVDYAYLDAAQGKTSPIKNVVIPADIYASDYDLGTYNVTWSDSDYQNTTGSSKNEINWNKGKSYRNDGVDIFLVAAEISTNQYYVGDTKAGEWLRYTVEAAEKGIYELYVQVAGAGEISILPNGKDTNLKRKIQPVGTASDWQFVYVGNINLPKGINQLKIMINQGGFNLNCIRVTKKGNVNPL